MASDERCWCRYVRLWAMVMVIIWAFMDMNGCEGIGRTMMWEMMSWGRNGVFR